MTENEVATEVDVVVLKEEKKKGQRSRPKVMSRKKLRSRQNCWVAIITIPSKVWRGSRQFNNVMKYLMSQPDDNLSFHNLLMSRQTIICRDIRGKFVSWAAFNFAKNLMTAHNCCQN